MTRFLRPLLFAAMLVCSAAHAFEVAGVRIEPRARVAGQELVLNGAGLRRMFATDIYVIGLYLPQRVRAAEAALQAPGPKRIALTLKRELTAQSLVDALREGVRENTTDAEFERLHAAVEALAATMMPLRSAKKGDVLVLDFDPSTGLRVVVNERAVGATLRDNGLYAALLRIWLGAHPVDRALKNALLEGRVE